MSITRTKSKNYILPLLSEVLPLENRFIKYIENTYLYMEGFDKERMYLHLKHRFSFKIPEFKAYENNLKRSEYFECATDDGDYVIYTFRIPKEYSAEYNYFIQGKYSEFGDDAKKLIMRFLNSQYLHVKEASRFLVRIRRVLYKDENLRKEWLTERGVDIPKGQELESIINIDDETLKIMKTINADGI